MEITDIRLSLAKKEGGTKAYGSFSLDGQFAVRGIRVMEDKNGRNFVAFPSRERANGEYEDIAFLLSKELYHKIDDAIVAEYKRTIVLTQIDEKLEAQKETEEKEQAEAQSEEKSKEETAAPKRGRGK